MASSRSAGQRAGLTKDRVLAAAMDLVATGGVAGLTMRSLADRLDVRPNTLYSHVRSKDALLEDLADGLLGQVATPAAGMAWRPALHAMMRSSYDVLVAHPDLVPLYLGRGSRGPNARRLGEVMLRLLDRGGITGRDADQAVRVLVVYAIGFAAYAVQPGFTGSTSARSAELLANYESGLEWLLTGISSIGPEGTSRPRTRARG